ncbi:hypothetical protein AAG570_010271 [Ranatra chinensis]|uniref:LIM and SH3 domain protein Lasp n=1 Tax=Ranatra chinensis TaxID=642074 RepID=A0ABD0YM30_9HEMI
MNKKCARCEKTVYPIEELKCLDKIWHKQCFKCQVCNMTLNMRNYKGFNKDPYCEAHIPKAKATTVAETPEFKRIAENTKLQSNVKYHADFEKAKGKVTQVADDPETLRIKQNSKIISNVAYHGDLQKKAEMEQKRNINGENGDATGIAGECRLYYRNGERMKGRSADYTNANQPVPTEYTNPPPPSNTTFNSPYSARQASTVIYTSDRGPVNSPAGRHIGSIADFDPVNNYYGSLTSQNPQLQTHQPQPTHVQRGSGRVYRAIYDYEAQDGDEVSFVDGDLIVDCTSVDAGWMTGLVQRTGQMGMLPANYVEPAI